MMDRATTRREADVRLESALAILKRWSWLFPALVGVALFFGIQFSGPGKRIGVLEAQAEKAPEVHRAIIDTIEAEFRRALDSVALRIAEGERRDSVTAVILTRLERQSNVSTVVVCAALTPREHRLVEVCDNSSARSGLPYRTP